MLASRNSPAGTPYARLETLFDVHAVCTGTRCAVRFPGGAPVRVIANHHPHAAPRSTRSHPSPLSPLRSPLPPPTLRSPSCSLVLPTCCSPAVGCASANQPVITLSPLEPMHTQLTCYANRRALWCRVNRRGLRRATACLDRPSASEMRKLDI
eukprot:scaffold63005_cov36-Tisochrysis_lutea.AAC.1